MTEPHYRSAGFDYMCIDLTRKELRQIRIQRRARRREITRDVREWKRSGYYDIRWHRARWYAKRGYNWFDSGEVGLIEGVRFVER